MHWFYVQDKVFNPANNHSAACIHIGRRDCIPKFALDENLARRRERCTDNCHCADHPLRPGYHFVSTGLERDGHKKNRDDPNRNSYRKGRPEMYTHLRDWSIDQ